MHDDDMISLTQLREKLIVLKGMSLDGLGDLVIEKARRTIRTGEEQMGLEMARDDSDKAAAIAAKEAAKKPKKPKKK